MNVLYLEDHEFFAQSVKNIIRLMFPGIQVDYVKTYDEAVEKVKNSKYDISLIDVILTNGKTGLQFVEKYHDRLGRIMFITGCIDDTTLTALEKYNAMSKLDSFKTNFIKLLNGKPIKINE